MITTILFDIDNTLIFFDEKTFITTYVKRLASRFKDGIPSEQFAERLMHATKALLDNRGRSINADFYMNNFTRDFDLDIHEVWNRFTDFYTKEFNCLKGMTDVAPGLATLFTTLQNRGFNLIIASNPFWPLSVQQIRLGWAGIADYSFLHITHIENSSWCKPQPEYYQEICTLCNLKPENCLMVGNDPLNDMNAGKIGMKTYLTTDAVTRGVASLSESAQISHAYERTLHDPDFTGPLSELISYLESL